MKLILLISVIASLAGCAGPQTRNHAHEMLNAALWQQTAGEYEGLTRQVYRTARDNLDRALADRNWSAALEQNGDYADLPAAIMLDLDETVLDNGKFEARIIRRYGQYSWESFAEWCREAAAPAVPGAPDFLHYAESRGVTVFYYSARRESLRECTARNLKRLDLPLPDMSRLLLANGLSKADYRRRIAGQYRILLLVGDNLEDFVDGSKAGSEQRRSLVRRHADRWGRQWMVLPNAMYGHWESSLYHFDYRLPRSEQLRHKLDSLTE